jgi:hypothetical protein
MGFGCFSCLILFLEELLFLNSVWSGGARIGRVGENALQF